MEELMYYKVWTVRKYDEEHHLIDSWTKVMRNFLPRHWGQSYHLIATIKVTIICTIYLAIASSTHFSALLSFPHETLFFYFLKEIWKHHQHQKSNPNLKTRAIPFLSWTLIVIIKKDNFLAT